MSTNASIKCTSDENTFWLSYGFFFTDTERKRVSSSGLLQVNTLKEILQSVFEGHYKSSVESMSMSLPSYIFKNIYVLQYI